jgi:RNA polymerase sigma-70 factor (ECF subfamily)
VIPAGEADSDRVERARQGDGAAVAELIDPFRRPLFAYIYRMVTHRQDAEDLMQEVFIRVMESIGRYRGDGPFKSWLFGIATHVCLDKLREKRRWRTEAQLIGEKEIDHDPEGMAQLRAVLSQPDFVFETREHIAFCFACIGRTLPPEEQAALLLREVLGFTAIEAAQILNVSEPVLRHRLAAARAAMTGHYEGLCALINKNGRCYQCAGLRELSPEGHKGQALVQIEVRPGLAVTPENLFDARLDIVRHADLENGATRPMHDLFFSDLSRREDARSSP